MNTNGLKFATDKINSTAQLDRKIILYIHSQLQI